MSSFIDEQNQRAKDFFRQLDQDFIGLDKTEDEEFIYKSTDVLVQSNLEVPIIVQWPESSVTFEFFTKQGDINFGVVFVAAPEEDCEVTDEDVVTLIDTERYDSYEEGITGNFTPPCEGVLFFIWDNAHDWMSNKKVTYTIKVHQPSFTLIDRIRTETSQEQLVQVLDQLDTDYNLREDAKDSVRNLSSSAAFLQLQMDKLQQKLQQRQREQQSLQNEEYQLVANIELEAAAKQGLQWRFLTRNLLLRVLSYLHPCDAKQISNSSRVSVYSKVCSYWQELCFTLNEHNHNLEAFFAELLQQQRLQYHPSVIRSERLRLLQELRPGQLTIQSNSVDEHSNYLAGGETDTRSGDLSVGSHSLQSPLLLNNNLNHNDNNYSQQQSASPLANTATQTQQSRIIRLPSTDNYQTNYTTTNNNVNLSVSRLPVPLLRQRSRSVSVGSSASSLSSASRNQPRLLRHAMKHTDTRLKLATHDNINVNNPSNNNHFDITAGHDSNANNKMKLKKKEKNSTKSKNQMLTQKPSVSHTQRQAQVHSDSDSQGSHSTSGSHKRASSSSSFTSNSSVARPVRPVRAAGMRQSYEERMVAESAAVAASPPKELLSRVTRKTPLLLSPDPLPNTSITNNSNYNNNNMNSNADVNLREIGFVATSTPHQQNNNSNSHDNTKYATYNGNQQSQHTTPSKNATVAAVYSPINNNNTIRSKDRTSLGDGRYIRYNSNTNVDMPATPPPKVQQQRRRGRNQQIAFTVPEELKGKVVSLKDASKLLPSLTSHPHLLQLQLQQQQLQTNANNTITQTHIQVQHNQTQHDGLLSSDRWAYQQRRQQQLQDYVAHATQKIEALTREKHKLKRLVRSAHLAQAQLTAAEDDAVLLVHNSHHNNHSMSNLNNVEEKKAELEPASNELDEDTNNNNARRGEIRALHERYRQVSLHLRVASERLQEFLKRLPVAHPDLQYTNNFTPQPLSNANSNRDSKRDKSVRDKHREHKEDHSNIRQNGNNIVNDGSNNNRDLDRDLRKRSSKRPHRTHPTPLEK